MNEKTKDDPSKLMITGLRSRPQSARAVLQSVSFAQKLRSQVSSLVPSDKAMHPVPNPGDEVRRQTNTRVFHYMREQRRNAAVLRKSIVELEEELKVLNRVKHAAELALQNTRKRMSTNHQALTMRERMHKHMQHGPAVQSLQRENSFLSVSKCDLETQLQQIKHQSRELDRVRRALQIQVGPVSSTLDMSNNGFQIYQTGPLEVSRGRHYETSCTSPIAPREASWTVGSNTAMSSKFQDILLEADGLQAKSRTLRQQLKHVLEDQEDSQKQMQEIVSQALRQEVEQLKSQKRDMMMEHGDVRVAQNKALRLQMQQEVSLGLTLGPNSLSHRTIAQREDRPLAKRKQGCTAGEHKAILRAASALQRELTATRSSVGVLATAGNSLNFGVKAKRAEIDHETRILHLRKRAADNRWVQ